MMHTLRATISKFAALALAGVIAFALYLLVLAPAYARFQNARDALDGQRQLLTRLKQQTAGQGSDTIAGNASTRDTSRRLYLSGESDAVMAAALQSALSAKGEVGGWRVVSTRVLPPKQEGALRLIGIEGRLETTIDGLQRLLLALEAQRPLLAVTALQATPTAALSAPGATEREGELAVRLELYAAALPEQERGHGSR